MQAQQKSRLGSAVEQSQQLYVGFEKGRMKIQVLTDKKVFHIQRLCHFTQFLKPYCKVIQGITSFKISVKSFRILFLIKEKLREIN